MKKIFSEFVGLYKSEPLIMFLLSWLLLAGTTLSTYATSLLVPLVLTNGKIFKGADRMFVLIVMYSTLYSSFCYLNGFYGGAKGNVIFQSLFPPTFYLIGKWMARSKTEKSIILFFLVLVSFIAVPVISDVINDIRTNQFINVLRTIELADGSEVNSATNLGMRLSLAVASVGILFSKWNGRFEGFSTILFLIVASLGITCVIHLINRTGLVVAAVSILTVFIFNVRHLSKKTIIIMSIGILVLTMFYIPQLQFVNDVNEAYLERDKEGSSVYTGGGRTEFWIMGVNSLFENPLGIDASTKYRYAHNYWLDTSIRGGIFAFIFLLSLTIKHLINSWHIIKYKNAGLLRSLIITTNIGFILTGFVEPIMEGFMVYVFLFFMFIGIVQQYKNQLRV